MADSRLPASIHTLTGYLAPIHTLTGYLANATLRGVPVELRVSGTVLQWKYEDEETWKDLINLSNLDYEQLQNLATINGVEFKGEMADYILTPDDFLTNAEVDEILAN